MIEYTSYNLDLTLLTLEYRYIANSIEVKTLQLLNRKTISYWNK